MLRQLRSSVRVLLPLMILVFTVGSVLAKMPESRNREDIPAKYKWNFNDIYPNWEAWQSDKEQIQQMMDQFVGLRGTLSDGPDNLAKAMKLSDQMDQLSYKVYRYPQLQRDVDTRNNEVGAKLQEVSLMFAQFGQATAWLNPEILSIPWETMKSWLDNSLELEPYRHSIENLYRQQEHVLDEKGEQLLSYFSSFNGTPRDIFSELSTSDVEFEEAAFSDGETKLVTPATYSLILETNRNQDDRRTAFETMYQVYADKKNTYAAIYNSICQRDWAQAQARNYNSTLEAALFDDNVPVEVYENLVTTVKNGTAPLQKYFKLRKEALGLEEYHLYDGAVPVVEFDKKYDYDEMLPKVVSAVAPLGKAYQDKMKLATSSGWIDVYENEGKRTGAYSAGVYGVHPFMLMNYNETLNSVFTLAHELGHTLHTELSHENQPFATAQYTIFTAEVASTLNEALFLDYMLKQSKDPKERIKLLEQAIDNIAGTFYTQVMFADFEHQAHMLAEQGKPITADVLSELYGSLMKTYYGDSIVYDSLYNYLWARIPHFYNSPYYVYQYATCFASSAEIVKKIQNGTEQERKAATEKYLGLLKSGGSDYPMTLLQNAGADLTKPETFQAVINQMTDLVNRYEQELQKL